MNSSTAVEASGHPSGFWKLALGSVGVVYGDIGTSPLYAMREALHAAGRDGLIEEEVIGITSMLVWALILIVTFKYIGLILRAAEAELTTTDAAMLYLLGVVVAASRYRQGPAALTSVLSIAFFDFAFVPPYYTFSVGDAATGSRSW